MADKKTSIIIPMSRPRNPFHDEVKNRRAGPHGASRKAVRQQQRQNMLRNINALVNGEKTEFEID